MNVFILDLEISKKFACLQIKQAALAKHNLDEN